MTAEKPKLQISGNWDGNIFSVIGHTIRALKRAKRQDLVPQVTKLMTTAKSYDEALSTCLQLLQEAGYEIE